MAACVVPQTSLLVKRSYSIKDIPSGLPFAKIAASEQRMKELSCSFPSQRSEDACVWERYVDQSFTPYLLQLNDWIDIQYKAGKSHISYRNQGAFTIFFDRKIERNDVTGEEIPIRRVPMYKKLDNDPPRPELGVRAANPHINNRFVSDPFTIQYPGEWEPQESVCELKILAQTPEYHRISRLVVDSLPSAKIVKIERIQNQHLWQRYYLERYNVQLKNGFTNEMELFHGSRSAQPYQIYNGEQGFDIRFARKGKWGVGIYFASRSCYSYHFAYTDPATGYKQIFLSRVATGCAYTSIDGNPELHSPPRKPYQPQQTQETSTEGIIEEEHVRIASRIPFAIDYYDSVVGMIGSSKIYTVFSNNKAYPSYVITLKPP